MVLLFLEKNYLFNIFVSFIYSEKEYLCLLLYLDLYRYMLGNVLFYIFFIGVVLKIDDWLFIFLEVEVKFIYF